MNKFNPKPYLERHSSRREFLRHTGLASLGLLTGGYFPFLTPIVSGQDKVAESMPAGMPDLDISLTARAGEVSLFSGQPTRVWQYHATVIQGDQRKVAEIPGSYLGPIIKVNQGDKIRVRFSNAISEESNIHWHGLHVPSIMDGHPNDVIGNQKSYHYEFVVKNRAGTYWYHPHPHGRTGPQVYGGLAGLFIVSDPEERSLGLPDGDHDISLVIQDRTFDDDNQLVYLSGHMMERMTGFLGNAILVNGKPDFTMNVSRTAYRLRLLNGSNSRIYRLAWKDGRPLIVIGTDGGLLERPVIRRTILLGPGERLELWADFSDNPARYETALISLPFDEARAAGSMMGRGMMGRRSGGDGRQAPGTTFSILKISVTDKKEKALPLPQHLTEIEPIRIQDAENVHRPRRFHLAMGHMRGTINGRVFQMEEVSEDEVVELGTREVWEFRNTGGSMMRMMDMPHPIHLHGKSFRVIERGGVRHEGYMDEGLKDTVLLMPGERIRILVDFDEYPGMYLYHCHNLEHEDMGMMRNYFVKGYTA